MRLVGVLGGGLLATSICCCGDGAGLISKVRALVGKEEPAPPPPDAPAPAPVVQESIPVGVPAGAKTLPASPGVFLRYTSEDLDVQRARQYHNGWYRAHGWQVQVDQATANGWTLEGVKGAHRLTVNILPAAPQGVNVVFTLL